MIGEPLNDRQCLDQLNVRAAQMAATPEAARLAWQLGTLPAVETWLRSLPQLDDRCDQPSPGAIACDYWQRVRLFPSDPNCVERAAAYAALAQRLRPDVTTHFQTINVDPTGEELHTIVLVERIVSIGEPTVTTEIDLTPLGGSRPSILDGAWLGARNSRRSSRRNAADPTFGSILTHFFSPLDAGPQLPPVRLVGGQPFGIQTLSVDPRLAVAVAPLFALNFWQYDPSGRVYFGGPGTRAFALGGFLYQPFVDGHPVGFAGVPDPQYFAPESSSGGASVSGGASGGGGKSGGGADIGGILGALAQAGMKIADKYGNRAPSSSGGGDVGDPGIPWAGGSSTPQGAGFTTEGKQPYYVGGVLYDGETNRPFVMDPGLSFAGGSDAPQTPPTVPYKVGNDWYDPSTNQPYSGQASDGVIDYSEPGFPDSAAGGGGDTFDTSDPGISWAGGSDN